MSKTPIWTALAAALVVASCTAANPSLSTDTEPTTVADPAVNAPSAASNEVAADTPQPDPANTTGAGASPTGTGAEAAVVEVDSSALPRDIANALSTNGGELASTADWAQRFGTNNLPVLTGTSVHLVEATIQITGGDAVWTRLDELQWIFATPASRDALLDQLAAAVNIGGWDIEATTSNVDSAECVVREYRSPTASDVWTLQGCVFPTFNNMLSIGVSHTSNSSDLGVLPFIDPSVAGVLTDADANFVQLLVTFGAPSPGSTSTLTISLDATTTPADSGAADALAAGELQSWNRSGGEAGSAVFTGAPGSFWTATGTDLRFTNEGRLAP